MKLTEEKLLHIFQDEDTSWDGDNAMQGLKILEKYVGENEELIVGADHDIIYSIDINKALENGLTEEDAIKLRKVGWMIEHGDYFACFV